MAESPLEQRPGLRIARSYPVAPQRLWRAWTDPQALSRWFGPGEADSVTQAELDVREGGRYSIRFRTQDGEEHGVSGVYQVVEPPTRLVFTWAWQSTPERVSRVTVEIAPVAGGCELVLLHDRFFDRQARDNHVRGWTGTIAKLDAMIAAL